MLWHAWMMNQAQYDSGGCCRFVIPAQAGIHIFGRNLCGNIDDWRGVMDAESSSA